MPERIVTHWNWQGNPDGFNEKGIGLFFLPVLAFLLAGLFYIIPRVDPKKENFSLFQKEYETFWVLVQLFLLYLLSLMILYNLGYSFSIIRALLPAFTILFFYLSILLEKAKPNWFVGIRTPWTLSSETVWNKTHQLGAKLFRAIAALYLVGIFFPPQFLLALVALVIASAISLFVYSYLLFRKEKK